MSSSGVIFITTPEPLALEMSPDEDFLITFEDIQDDESETPIPHTDGVMVMEVIDSDGDVILSMASNATTLDRQGVPMLFFIVPRSGTTNIFDIRVPWDVVAGIPPGQYEVDLVERRYADSSREVLTSFIFQRSP